jgi:hypothetical protein
MDRGATVGSFESYNPQAMTPSFENVKGLPVHMFMHSENNCVTTVLENKWTKQMDHALQLIYK